MTAAMDIEQITQKSTSQSQIERGTVGDKGAVGRTGPEGQNSGTVRKHHYHIAHRSELDGEVFHAGQDPEIWSTRESAARRIDRILRHIRCRQHVAIICDRDRVQISWHDHQAVERRFRVMECSRPDCPGGSKG